MAFSIDHHNPLLLTFMEGREEDPEFALSASFIGPQPHNAHRGRQHDIVGHRGAELIFQVLDWTAAIINGDKVTLALIWVVHLVLKESHVDLWVHCGIEKRKSAVSGPGEWSPLVFKSKYLRLNPDIIQSPKGHFSFTCKKLYKTTTEQDREINNRLSHTDLSFWRSLDVPPAVYGLSLQRAALRRYLHRLHKAFWTTELKVTSCECQFTVNRMPQW